jgi:hypothetical protein
LVPGRSIDVLVFATLPVPRTSRGKDGQSLNLTTQLHLMSRFMFLLWHSSYVHGQLSCTLKIEY